MHLSLIALIVVAVSQDFMWDLRQRAEGMSVLTAGNKKQIFQVFPPGINITRLSRLPWDE